TALAIRGGFMDPYLVFRRARALGAAAAILMLVLVLAPGARPASAPPLVELQSVTIANGAATISGTLGPTAAGAEVTVNGHPLSLDSSGHFAGVVQLGGASSLDLGVANSVSGEHTHFTIPLTDSLAGVGAIPGDVLSAVQHAGASLVQPAGGFSIVDGKPLVIGGGVADGSGLAGLTVNGVDALALLKPDQSFTLTLPGTTKAVTLTTTDTGGISETRSFSVLQHSTLLRTSKGISVAASGALGVRIAQVRYLTKGV